MDLDERLLCPIIRHMTKVLQLTWCILSYLVSNVAFIFKDQVMPLRI